MRPGSPEPRLPTPLGFWITVLLAIAVAKIVAALGGVAVGGLGQPSPGPGSISPWIHLVHLLVFGAAALWLILGGRRDPRAAALGGTFLLIAAVFSNRLAATLAAAASGAGGSALSLLVAVQIHAFLPFFLWVFAAQFPRVRQFGPDARFGRVMVRVSLMIGAVLVAASLAATYRPELATSALVRALSRQGSGLYWPIVSVLILGALAFVVWRIRHAEGAERRRARLFIAALVLGIGPLFVEVLLHSLIPPFARLMDRPTARLVGGAILYPLLLSIPITTTYAVLVHHVFDVRLVVRKAIRYALARYSVVTLAAIPFLALIHYMYTHRSKPIVEILSGPGALVLLGLTGAGAAALRLRLPILRALDRRFFREQYDAQRMFSDLARSIRKVADVRSWAALLTSEIDRALHLHSQSVLLLDAASGAYLPVGAAGIRELAAATPLVKLAAAEGAPLRVDVAEASAIVEKLPEEDRQWLADGGFEVLVPIVASSGEPLALVALGEKKSELPFTGEDLSLLGNLAVAAAGSLELRSLVASGGPREPTGGGEAVVPARECRHCWTVHAAVVEECPGCGRELAKARVPSLLAGKFQLERRLGAGGMGVVYQAWDKSLDRPVAVKTLPRLDAERAMRMRREARAMAAVAHPNLAAIYAVESWRGTPFLILELLEGGTLDERIAEEPLLPGEVIALGIDLAGALAQLHGRGMLHRDVKPTNIGFTAAGTAKLLDFGLARLLAGLSDRAAVQRRPISTPGPGDQGLTADYAPEAAAGMVEGTPPYMAPEARAGRAPSPSFDLWSLAVVLWEALTGRRPFPSPDAEGETGDPYVLDLSVVPPGAPPQLLALLERALNPSPRQRPATAKDFAARLRALR